MSQAKPTFNKRRTGGVMSFLFVILLISGFLRLGDGEFAWAQEIAALSTGSDTPTAKTKPAPAACVVDQDTGA
jgi:hypothetical protein